MGRMDDLRAIRVFLAVADRQSFAAAARALAMTPAAVTRTVARLEEALGRQLLIRTTRKVSLTRAGAQAATRYRPLLEDIDTATQALTRDNRPDRGHLTLNAPLSLGVRILPGLIDSFRLAYPNIAVELKLTDALVDIMTEGSDLAIRISGPPTDKSTIWRKICVVPRCAVAAPSLFERMPRPTEPALLDPDVCMSYSDTGQPEAWTFTRGPQQRSVRAGTGVVSNNGDFLSAMAVSGAGITVLPEFIVQPHLETGALERVLPEWQVSQLWLTLYYPPYDALPPLVATFSEFFETYLRDLDSLVFES
jgi:DNA-binding transcriptional LysR family regulator